MLALFRRLFPGLPLALSLLLAAPGLSAPPRLPELAYPYDDQADRWINSEPLSVRDLRGKPTLVMFWTYGCYNCRNSIAWINEMHRRFAPLGLQVIGIHTPEFDHEKDAATVARHTHEHGIEFPVMLDNDFVYWKDMRNMYTGPLSTWPTP